MWWNCPSCSKSVDDVWAYCPYCGGALFETCRECGKKEPIGRTVCLTRLDNIERTCDEYAEKFAEKAIIKNTSVFARIGLKIDGIFPGLGLACLVLLTLILFAVGVFVLEQVMPKVGISDQIATGTSVLIMFLGSLGIVALLFHLDPDTKKNKYKKKGAVEYYKTHPVDGVIMQFVKSNSKTTEP